jgi:outer membrane protein OmpU
MKHLLLGTAAIALGLAFAAPVAQAADGVKLDVGGYFKGYVTWHDQDEITPDASDARSFDILRDTEIHFTGETTLDNGLTVGFHTEELADPGDGFDVQESYAYFSGGWGRVNFGAEDGAAYLLQVAAPSADSNVDGLRQYIQPVNYAIARAPYNLIAAVPLTIFKGDYAQDATGYYDKITYLSPVFSGFQVGLSYTPDVLNYAANTSRGIAGVTLDNVEDSYGAAWEGSARYEGQFQNLDVTLGGGYTHVNLEKDALAPGTLDDRKVWNVGGNLGWSAFNLGAAYKHDNYGLDNNGSERTWVVGVDYTTGPYRLGASYADRKNELASAAIFGPGTPDLDSKRYSGGVGYTYGPGMTFRGSVHYINHDDNTAADGDMSATSVLLGTQINF